jgi:drug/metabolite transporter (DMT)-like permease
MRGILLMLGAGVCWSSGGIIVRSLTLKEPWEIVFWRALFMALTLAVLLACLRGAAFARSIASMGRAGWLAGACLAAQMVFFVMALLNTTAANTFVLMSLAPLTAALAGAWFLRERVALHTWFAIAVALAGVVIMFGEGVTGGRWLGNLFALAIPLAYACQISFARRMQGGGQLDLLPTLLAGGVMAMLPALALAWPLQAGARDIALLAMMGSVQLALGCWLMTLALRHLSAAQMGLLALTETILAPLWVWLGVGEAPGQAALAGGTLIVGALAANAVAELRLRPAK